MIRIFLFLVGLVSFTLFLAWGIGAFFFVMGDSSHYGAVAYMPHWVFLLSVFIVFYRSRPVQRFFTKVERVFF